MRKFRSKFPLTRIKKIMQMDEDVGKVSGATPICISKALECFLALLVKNCIEEAQKHNSSRLSPAFVYISLLSVNFLKRKKAVMGNEKFDFLAVLVSGISDATHAVEDERKPKRKRKTKAEMIAEKAAKGDVTSSTIDIAGEQTASDE